MIGGNLGAAVQMLKVINQQGGGSQSWESYWAARYPSTLIVITTSDTELELRWVNVGMADYDNIVIERKTEHNDFAVIDTIATGLATYTDDTLTPNTIYIYRVRYVKGANYSAYTSEVRGVTFPTEILSKTGEVNDSLLLIDYLDPDTLTVADNIVTKWANKMGVAAYDVTLGQGLLTDEGIYFDGGTDYMRALSINILQPYTMYFAVRLNYVAGKYVFGLYSTSGYVLQSGSGMLVRMGLANSSTVLIIDKCGNVGKIVGNGDSSRFEINNQGETTGNYGTGGVTTLTIANKAALNDGSKMFVQGILIRNKDEAANEEAFYRYFVQKYLRRFDEPIFLLTTDHPGANLYTDLLPLFVSKGIKATHYIPTGEVGGVGNVTWANLLEIYAAGIDVQCHTVTHPHLDELTQEQVVAEMTGVNTAFTTNGLPAPEHHAYPYGDYSSDVITWITPYRKTGRRAGSIEQFQEQRSDLDKFRFDSMNLDGMDATDLNTIKGYIDEVAINHSMICTYMHTVPTLLPDLIDYALSKGLTFMTMKDFGELLD
jgi:peptidoglycan/xylan/chitin deacetylase (PgdA/CDA1 family)